MQDVTGAHADALYGGTIRAGWAAAVLAQPESAPAAATARSEAPLVNVLVACVPP